MAKQKVYLETSVISYLTARPSRDVIKLAHQEMTRDWWDSRRSQFDLYISNAVLDEIREGDSGAAAQRLAAAAEIPVLDIGASDEVDSLLERLLATKAVPAKAVLDAYHIAMAAVHGMAFLLTWNCKHINKAEQKHKITEAIVKAGYNDVVIATPEELGR